MRTQKHAKNTVNNLHSLRRRRKYKRRTQSVSYWCKPSVLNTQDTQGNDRVINILKKIFSLQPLADTATPPEVARTYTSDPRHLLPQQVDHASISLAPPAPHSSSSSPVPPAPGTAQGTGGEYVKFINRIVKLWDPAMESINNDRAGIKSEADEAVYRDELLALVSNIQANVIFQILWSKLKLLIYDPDFMAMETKTIINYITHVIPGIGPILTKRFLKDDVSEKKFVYQRLIQDADSAKEAIKKIQQILGEDDHHNRGGAKNNPTRVKHVGFSRTFTANELENVDDIKRKIKQSALIAERDIDDIITLESVKEFICILGGVEGAASQSGGAPKRSRKRRWPFVKWVKERTLDNVTQGFIERGEYNDGQDWSLGRAIGFSFVIFIQRLLEIFGILVFLVGIGLVGGYIGGIVMAAIGAACGSIWCLGCMILMATHGFNKITGGSDSYLLLSRMSNPLWWKTNGVTLRAFICRVSPNLRVSEKMRAEWKNYVNSNLQKEAHQNAQKARNLWKELKEAYLYQRDSDDDGYGSIHYAFRTVKRGKLLGRGAEGMVYEGTWGNSSVAIKIAEIYSSQSREVLSEQIKNLQEEVKVTMKLCHPNIVRVFGWFVEYPNNTDIQLVTILEKCKTDLSDQITREELTVMDKIKTLFKSRRGWNICIATM